MRSAARTRADLSEAARFSALVVDGSLRRGPGPQMQMSDENVFLARRGYEAFIRGDLSTALEDVDPNVEWQIYLVPGSGGNRYRGHEGVRQARQDAVAIFEGPRLEIEQFVGHGERVVAFLRLAERGECGRREVCARLAQLFVLREGKVVRLETYAEREALMPLVASKGQLRRRDPA
jgi:ketosteroid isomerase-like protein